MDKFCCICIDGGCNHIHDGPHTYCDKHDPADYYGTATPRGCPSLAAKDARIRELEEVTRELKADVNRYIERDEVWRNKKRVLENDLAKPWEEARQVCGALGEFYGKGQGTAVEKIKFMRKDFEAETERLRGDLRAATQELMDLAHSKPRPIHFFEDDGTERVLEWDEGDESVGIFSCYMVSDSKYAELQSRVAVLEKVAEAANQYLAYSVCRAPKDPNIERKREDELRAALDKLKEG